MENYQGYIYANWSEGTCKATKTPRFEDKLKDIILKGKALGVECNLKNGDVICIASPSNWEFQTYHETLKDFDGIFLSKDLKSVARISYCKNLVPSFERLKRPIKVNKSQMLLFRDGKLISLYEKGDNWLAKDVATKAVKEVAQIRGSEILAKPKVVELTIPSKTFEIKHLAWSFATTTGEKFYCLFNSGYIFSMKSSEVLSEKELKIDERRVISSDFVSYVLPNGEKNGVFSLYSMEDGIRCLSDKLFI